MNLTIINKKNTHPKATIKSLAKTLGISHTTVSNAWNKPEKLSAALREKIFACAQQVGFQGPDTLARAMRTGKLNTLGIIFNDGMRYLFTDHHDIHLMRGIAAECEKQNTNLMLIPLNKSQPCNSKPMTTLVDGYILNATYNSEEIIQQTLAKKLPLVTLDFSLPTFSSVSINNACAMWEISEYLIDNGHQHFGIIAFPSQKYVQGKRDLRQAVSGDNTLMLTRVNACRDAFIASRIPLANCWLYETQHDEIHGAEAAAALLTAHPQITALICLSDRFAAGAIDYCLRQGIAVPQQVAITGFDNADVDTHGIGLTTIAQDAVKKGEIAVQLLLQNGPVTHYELEYQLIRRASA